MSNLVFNRMAKEINRSKIINSSKPVEIIENELLPPVQQSDPIQPEELNRLLSYKIDPKPQILMNETQALNIEMVHFANLFEFAAWYGENKGSFNPKQQEALDTILEAKAMTIGGCNCDVDKRAMIAEDYFKNFWIRNKNTDLLPSLLRALNSKKVIFGDYLSFP